MFELCCHLRLVFKQVDESDDALLFLAAGGMPADAALSSIDCLLRDAPGEGRAIFPGCQYIEYGDDGVERAEVVRQLVGAGANVEWRTARRDGGLGMTPLCIAALLCKDPVVAALVAAGASVGPKTTVEGAGDISAVFAAAANGGHECVRQLFLAGGDLLETDARGYSLLHIATIRGHGEAVSSVLQWSSIKVDAADKVGRTALYWAAIAGDIKILDTLIATGTADVNKTADDGSTPLMAAIECGNWDAAQHIIDYAKRSVGWQTTINAKRYPATGRLSCHVTVWRASYSEHMVNVSVGSLASCHLP